MGNEIYLAKTRINYISLVSLIRTLKNENEVKLFGVSIHVDNAQKFAHFKYMYM